MIFSSAPSDVAQRRDRLQLLHCRLRPRLLLYERRTGSVLLVLTWIKLARYLLLCKPRGEVQVTNC